MKHSFLKNGPLDGQLDRSPALNELEQYHDDGHDQQDVNKPTHRGRSHHSHRPQNQQNYENGPKHVSSPCNESEMALTKNYNRIPTLPRRVRPWCLRSVAPAQQKKADVEEYREVSLHVGLLVNEPPGPGLNQTGRVALYLGIRRTQLKRGAAFTQFAGPLRTILPSGTAKIKEIVIFAGSACGHKA